MTKIKDKSASGSTAGVEPVHVFKTTTVGNGALYGWKEVDENGELVRESEQTYASEADAEKAIRTLVSSSNIVEVVNVKNINAEANTNVNLVKLNTKDENFGMNVVSRSVETTDVSEPAKIEEHANVAKMPPIDEAIDARLEVLAEEKAEADEEAAEREAKRLADEEKEAKKAKKDE